MDFVLSGIPSPIPSESLNSWIQRACQIYDLTFHRFHETFDTTTCIDQDLSLTEKQIDAIASRCRLDESEFKFIKHGFCRVDKLSYLPRLLLYQNKRLPLYRYCSQCLAADRTPFLRMEWRYKAWSICPLHLTLLQSQCPTCQNYLATHHSILGGTIRPVPVQNLAICIYCRTDLRKVEPSPQQRLQLTEKEILKKVSLQRAIVSAVLHGYFIVAPFNEKLCLSLLPELLEDIGLDTLTSNTEFIFSSMSIEDKETLKDILNKPSLRKQILNPKKRNTYSARNIFDLWKFQQ